MMSMADGNIAIDTFLLSVELGLCSTCNAIETCVPNKKWRGAVVHCEQFDDHVPTTVSSKQKDDLPEIDTKRPDPTDRPRGLCVNCAHGSSCKLMRPEGGVWHCEEYE